MLQFASDQVSGNSASAGAGTVLFNIPCDSTVFVGAAVRMNAAGTAFNANAGATSTANVLGIVIAKPTTTTCNIRVAGATGALFVGLDPTKVYFLDTTDGNITDTAPTGSGIVQYQLGQPLSATRFVVDKGKRTVLA